MPILQVAQKSIEDRNTDYEIKLIKLGYAMKKDKFETSESFLDTVNENRKELGLQFALSRNDVQQSDDLFYIVTGKRYEKVLDEALLRTGVTGVYVIVDSYKWKVSTKKTSQLSQ